MAITSKANDNDGFESDETPFPVSLEQVLQWLQPTDFENEAGEFRKHVSAHTPGTSEWIRETDEWKRWVDGGSDGLLWIKGIPGSGKSVIAAHSVKRLAQAGYLVLYFFFRQINEATHTPAALLRDWLAQLVPSSPTLHVELSTNMDAERKIESVGIDDLWRLLRLGLQHQDMVYLIADALDEMDHGNEESLQSLAAIAHWRPDRVKLFITSRPVPAVEMPLRQAQALQIRLSEREVDADIVTFVSGRLRASSVNPEDQLLIREAVPGRANGLFLYAKLALDKLLEAEVDIRQTIGALPADLHDLFSTILSEHAVRSGISSDVQVAVLQWVTHASRPMRLLEISEAINACTGISRRDTLKSTKALVRASCGPLIEILPDETLSVVHHSLTEFLRGEGRSLTLNDRTRLNYPVLGTSATHTDLALACLKYLLTACMGDVRIVIERLDKDTIRLDDTTKARLDLKYPFLSYAVQSWHFHVFNASLKPTEKQTLDKVHALLDQILESDDLRKSLSFLIQDRHGMVGLLPIHIAAWAGLDSYGAILLDRDPAVVDSTDKEGNTPLHWAARKGRGAFVELVRDRGANVNAGNEDGLTPLHLAASNNEAEVVTLILRAGVDPMTRRTKNPPMRGFGCTVPDPVIWETALMYACHGGHAGTVRAFIAFLDPIGALQALIWAISADEPKCVREALLRPALDVNARFVASRWRRYDGKSSQVESALTIACHHGNPEIIRSLLDSGASADLPLCEHSAELPVINTDRSSKLRWRQPDDGHLREKRPLSGHTALMSYCEFAGHLESEDAEGSDTTGSVIAAVRMLIGAGADVNAADSHGDTPLHYMCAHTLPGSSVTAEVIRILLEAGAACDATNHDGQLPLHKCYVDHSGECLDMLLARQPDQIDRKDTQGRTPLLTVMTYREDFFDGATIMHLLRYKPDCNVVDPDGNTPLHLMMKLRTQNKPGRFGGWKLGKAGVSKRGYACPRDDSLVEAMLAAGANPNARNKQKQTPLHVLKLLRDNSRTETAVSDSGRDGDSGAFGVEREPISLLSRAGADLDAQDDHGQSILFQTIKSEPLCSAQVVDLFLDMGCSITTRDLSGRSLFHEVVRKMKNSKRLAERSRLIEMFEHLLARGLDAGTTDFAGNTSFHEAALRDSRFDQGHMDVLTYLKTRVDPDQANHAGQTSLHVVAGTAVDGREPLDSWFSKFSQICQDKNAADRHGVVPLHLAATISESYVMQLLQVGASMAIATNEGMTALHLAARARQSNILGVLCEHLSTAADLDTSHIIDAVDKDGRTALHHACRSGRVESVAVLLRHGASVNIADEFGITPTGACAEFREEQDLWRNAKSHRGPIDRLSADGARLGSGGRPAKRPGGDSNGPRMAYEAKLNSEHHTTRVFDILKLMVSHGADLTLSIDPTYDILSYAMTYALNQHDDHTFNAFVEIRKYKGWEDTAKYKSFDLSWCSRRITSATEAFQEAVENGTARYDEDLLSRLLCLREYDLIRGIAKTADEATAVACRRLFVKWGFADLLDDFFRWHHLEQLDPATEIKATRMREAEERKKGINVKWKDVDTEPLLIQACDRELSNLDTFKAILKHQERQLDMPCAVQRHVNGSQPEWIHGGTTLHKLANGRYWWHVGEAIPFLLAEGADINAKNNSGATPLHSALGYKPANNSTGEVWARFPGFYRKHAARLLIMRGADVNAVTDAGETCMSLTGDRELHALMIQHGARLDARSLFARIEKRDLEGVKSLLELGVDPNRSLRCGSEANETEIEREDQRVRFEGYAGVDSVSRQYPLHYAATRDASVPTDSDLAATDVQIVETLLRHGANPLSTFKRRVNDPSWGLTVDPQGEKEASLELTILHDVLYQGHYLEPFLTLHWPDIDITDGRRRTLLLAAACRCHHARSVRPANIAPTSSLIQSLLDRGANLSSRDDDGNTLLHLAAINAWKPLSEHHSSLLPLLPPTAPLIPIRNLAGDTPFHLTWRHPSPSISSHLHVPHHGPTIFHSRRETLTPELFARFLDLGASPLDPDHLGNTPLHAIASALIPEKPRGSTPAGPRPSFPPPSADDQTAFVALFHRLLALGADIDARNLDGETPLLTLLSTVGREEMAVAKTDASAGEMRDAKALVSMLVDAGAEVGARNSRGETALHVLAGISGEVARAVFELLVGLGVDPLTEDGEQRTSLDVAVARGNGGVLGIFREGGMQ